MFIFYDKALRDRSFWPPSISCWLSVQIHAGVSARRRGTNADNLPGLNACERCKAIGNDRKEFLNPVRPRPNNQHGDLFGFQILLEGQILVERQQDIKLRTG
jgi:hypothetical protein